MAKASLQRHPAVIEADLPQIYQYIAADNPAAAGDYSMRLQRLSRS